MTDQRGFLLHPNSQRCSKSMPEGASRSGLYSLLVVFLCWGCAEASWVGPANNDASPSSGGDGVDASPTSDGDDVDAASHVPLRVMSFNIAGAIGSDGGYDLKRTADVIAAVDPDVVALQEVHDQYRAHWQDDSPTNYDAQHELLADWLGMNYVVFAPVRDYGRSDDPSWTEEEQEEGYRRRMGTVILSKNPILESNVYAHETDTSFDAPHQDVHNRHVAEAKINLDEGHVWFYSVHLHGGTGTRAIEVGTAQVQELLEIAGRRDGPKIVAGDFNFPDGEYGWNQEWFYPPHNDPPYQQYTAMTDTFTDVLREVGANAPTFAGPVRIDYTFASDGVAPVDGETVTFGAEPSPSDHNPIVVDVTVPK